MVMYHQYYYCYRNAHLSFIAPEKCQNKYRDPKLQFLCTNRFSPILKPSIDVIFNLPLELDWILRCTVRAVSNSASCCESPAVMKSELQSSAQLASV